MLRIDVYDQAIKSVWWMPWHLAPMKDAISCDKLRGAANRLRSVDFRMGKPTVVNPTVSLLRIHSAVKGTRGTETSKYPEEEKVKQRLRK